MGEKTARTVALALPAFLALAFAFEGSDEGSLRPFESSLRAVERDLASARSEACVEPVAFEAWPEDRAAAAFPAAAPLAEVRVEAEHTATIRICLQQKAEALLPPGFERALADSLAEGTPALEPEIVVAEGHEPAARVQAGRCDAAIVAGELSENDLRAGLRQTVFGARAFAFAVSVDSPIGALFDSRAARLLGAGIGGPMGRVREAPTLFFAGDRRLVSDAARLLLGADAGPVEGVSVASERQLCEQVARSTEAIGFSDLSCFAGRQDLRTLPISGIAPSDENLRRGAYPLGLRLCLVTSGDMSGAVKRLLASLEQIAAARPQNRTPPPSTTPETVRSASKSRPDATPSTSRTVKR
ncbi:MAG: hypothetical protein Fur0037_06690 [Planctomycetota bacterium]